MEPSLGKYLHANVGISNEPLKFATFIYTLVCACTVALMRHMQICVSVLIRDDNYAGVHHYMFPAQLELLLGMIFS